MKFPYRSSEKSVLDLYQNFMVPGDRSGVYIMAEDITELLSLEELFFDIEQTHTQCALACPELDYAVIYEFDSKEVFVYAAGTMIKYRSPIPTLYIDGVVWLPFEFTMKLFNISYPMPNDTLQIEAPKLSSLMAVSALNNSDYFSFDWIKEMNYSELSSAMAGGSAAVINFIQGLLTFKGYAWADLITVRSSNSTTKHFAQSIAEMFVAPSKDEISSLDNNIPYLFFETYGKVSEQTNNAFRPSKVTYDSVMDTVEEVIEKTKGFDNDNQISALNKILKTNKKGISKLLSEISGPIDKALSGVTQGSMLITQIMKIISIYSTFSNKNAFANGALLTYSNASDAVATNVLSSYAKTNAENTMGIIIQYFKNNIDTIITSALPISEILMLPATLLLIAWDILSNATPFIKNSLTSAEMFEFASCAISYQNDAKQLMLQKKAQTFTGTSVNMKQYDELTDLTYSYLKFSIIARNGASVVLNTTPGFSESTKKTRQKEFDAKNQLIGRFLTALENPNSVFLPSDVSSSKTKWNKDDLISILEKTGKLLKTVSQNKLVPQNEISNLPEDKIISEEEAINMAKKRLGGAFYKFIFDDMLQGEYKFEVVKSNFWVEEKKIHAYVIRMGIYEAQDEYCLFIPLDGSEIWIGWENPDGTYYCHSDVDLKHFRPSDLIESIEEMYAEAEALAQQQ